MKNPAEHVEIHLQKYLSSQNEYCIQDDRDAFFLLTQGGRQIDKEFIFKALFLNSSFRLRFYCIISKSAVPKINKYPELLFSKIPLHQVNYCLLAHNKPALEENRAIDDQLSKTILHQAKDKGLVLLDHLVFTSHNQYSSMTDGRLYSQVPAWKKTKTKRLKSNIPGKINGNSHPGGNGIKRTDLN